MTVVVGDVATTFEARWEAWQARGDQRHHRHEQWLKFALAFAAAAAAMGAVLAAL